jgi:hypothetical protein
MQQILKRFFGEIFKLFPLVAESAMKCRKIEVLWQVLSYLIFHVVKIWPELNFLDFML